MRTKWTLEKIISEAIKYDTRYGFEKGNQRAYKAALRNSHKEEIFSHMKSPQREKYTRQELYDEGSKYSSRGDFAIGNESAYKTALKREDFDKICTHMSPSYTEPYSDKELESEAAKYNTRREFQNKSPNSYRAALRNPLFEQFCNHMKCSKETSGGELEILSVVRGIFPDSRKLRDRRGVKIHNKPHIKGFDIDIFIPELNKGIEFDGRYHHSIAGLKRARPKWSDEDILNYHSLKDDWFSSKGIEILHIKEEDWNLNRNFCIEKLQKFLGV